MSSTAAPRSSQIALGVWIAAVAATVAVFWPLFAFDPRAGVMRAVGGLEGALFDPSGEDPRLIGTLALWMLLTRRGRIAAAWRDGAGRPALAAPLFGAAIAVHAWAAHVGGPDLLIHSLQLFLLGGAALLGGVEGLRAVRLPVLFLFLAMPIPAALLNAVLLPLQLGTVEVCTAILRGVGMEVWGYGDQILTHRGIFHVIESCSGVRLVQTLVMASVVYAELFGRRTRRTLVLIGLAPLVGIAVNLARILSIIFNPYASIASVHTTQGVAMVVLGVLALAGIDRLLERRWPDPPRSVGRSAPLLGVPVDRHLAVMGAVLVAFVAAHALTPRWVDGGTPMPLEDLPQQIDGRRANGRLPDLVFLGSVHFSNRIFRTYSLAAPAAENRPTDILLFLGVDDHENRRGSISSEKTAYPGRAWQRVAEVDAELADGTPVEVAFFVHPDTEKKRRQVAVHWREGLSGTASEALRGWSGIDRSGLRRTEPAVVWRVATEVEDVREAQAVRADLLRFAQAARNAWLEARANVRMER